MASAAEVKSRSRLLRLRSRTSAMVGDFSAAGFFLASAGFSWAKTLAAIIRDRSRTRFFIAIPLLVSSRLRILRQRVQLCQSDGRSIFGLAEINYRMRASAPHRLSSATRHAER